MSKFNKLTRAEMKNVLGGDPVDPLNENNCGGGSNNSSLQCKAESGQILGTLYNTPCSLSYCLCQWSNAVDYNCIG